MFRGFLGFPTGLLRLELEHRRRVSHRIGVLDELDCTYAGLEFDLHVAGHLPVRHGENYSDKIGGDMAMVRNGNTKCGSNAGDPVGSRGEWSAREAVRYVK